MPVSPFDDPGKSHPFIIFNRLFLTKPAFIFFFDLFPYLLTNDVKVTQYLVLIMDENTEFLFSGFSPTGALFGSGMINLHPRFSGKTSLIKAMAT